MPLLGLQRVGEQENPGFAFGNCIRIAGLLLYSRSPCRNGEDAFYYSKKRIEIMKASAGIPLLCFALAALMCQEAAAVGSLLRLHVNHRADLIDNPYEIEVWGADSISRYNMETEAVGLVAPDGTYFHTDRTGMPVTVGPLSLFSLITRFSGEWTIIDSLVTPSGSTSQRHSFEVTPSVLTALPPRTPSITWPLDGAHLPPVFNIVQDGVWAWLRGATIDYLTLDKVDLRGVEFESQIPQIVEARTSIDYSTTSLDARSLDASPRRRFNVRPVTYSFSLPMHWTVGVAVPEPSAIGLATFAFFSLAALRRRG